MKKFFVLLVALLLVFAAVLTYISYKPMPIADEAELTETPAYEGETLGESGAEGEEALPEYKYLDYEAIYALHQGDDTVVTVDGREVSWNEYFYWLFKEMNKMDLTFEQMLYYGMEMGWSDDVGEGMNASELAWENADFLVRQISAVEKMAAEAGVELDEADKAEIAAQLESEIAAQLGEDATEEDFETYLADARMSRDFYDRLSEANFLMAKTYTEIYGDDGELAEADKVIAWLEENEYMSAHHVLFMSIDPATGMELEEAAVEEKRAQAEKYAAELAAIEDDAERYERFCQLKEEFCEDTGKVRFPEGYTFVPGTMYPEFEEAVLALEPYAVSGVVESGAGFHLVMRLPLEADADVLTTSGSASSACALYANETFNTDMTETVKALGLEYAEGFERVFLGDYVLK